MYSTLKALQYSARGKASNGVLVLYVPDRVWIESGATVLIAALHVQLVRLVRGRREPTDTDATQVNEPPDVPSRMRAVGSASATASGAPHQPFWIPLDWDLSWNASNGWPVAPDHGGCHR